MKTDAADKKATKIIKEYVDVIVKHNTDGDIKPLALSLSGGKLYEIDKVKYKCRAASLKVGGTGIRYTVKVKNTVFFLFDEENGKWFIEKNILNQ
jgi:hypothetical protein